MTTKEAAKALGVSKEAFLALVKTKKIKSEGVIKTGKRGRPGLDWSREQIRILAKE